MAAMAAMAIQAGLSWAQLGSAGLSPAQATMFRNHWGHWELHEANTTLRKKTGSGKFIDQTIDQTETNRIKPQIYPNRMKPNLKHLSKMHETERNKCKSHTDLCCILKPG